MKWEEFSEREVKNRVVQEREGVRCKGVGESDGCKSRVWKLGGILA